MFKRRTRLGTFPLMIFTIPNRKPPILWESGSRQDLIQIQLFLFGHRQ